MKAEELDQKINAGEKMTVYLDVSRARRRREEIKRVNVDLPLWMIHSLDKEARRIGVPRQSIIKLWLAERLEKTRD